MEEVKGKCVPSIKVISFGLTSVISEKAEALIFPYLSILAG